MSTITEPCVIATTAPAVISCGAGLPGISAVVMMMSDCLRVLGEQRLLGGEEGLAHLLGVAARALARLFELELEELGAQALDLLAHRRAACRTRARLRAQAPRGGDRGQPGDARADDQHLRRLHAPGRRDLPGEEAAEVRAPPR